MSDFFLSSPRDHEWKESWVCVALGACAPLRGGSALSSLFPEYSVDRGPFVCGRGPMLCMYVGGGVGPQDREKWCGILRVFGRKSWENPQIAAAKMLCGFFNSVIDYEMVMDEQSQDAPGPHTSRRSGLLFGGADIACVVARLWSDWKWQTRHATRDQGCQDLFDPLRGQRMCV